MHINEIILAVVLISGIAVALYVKNKKQDSAPTSTPTTPPPAGTSGDGGSNDPDWTI
jgi:uncharacterized membrane protein